MNMKNLGINHYNLRAPRALLESLRVFYCEIVGLRVGVRPPLRSSGYWLYAGERDVLHLSEATEGEDRKVGVATAFDHVAFTCTRRIDFQEALDRRGSLTKLRAFHKRVGSSYSLLTPPVTGSS